MRTHKDLQTMRKFFFAAAVAVAALFATSSSADAAFRMRVESGTTTGPGVTLTDNGGGDIAAQAGAITYTGTIGQFNFNVTTGTTTPFAALPGFYEGMDLNNITINAGGAGTLRIILENDGYGALTPDGFVNLATQIGGVLTANAGSTITFDSYADDSNATPNLGADVFPTAALAAVTGIPGAPNITQTFVAGAFSGSAGAIFNQSGTYSMYTIVPVNFTPAGSVSLTPPPAPPPPPAGLVLGLVGLPVFGVGAWIRRRKGASVA